MTMQTIEPATPTPNDATTLSGVLSGIRDSITGLRRARAEGTAPPKAAIALRELREEEEATADRLAIVERRIADEQAHGASAVAIEAWEARRDHVAALLAEAERIDAAVIAASEALAVALGRLIENARTIAVSEPPAARFQAGRLKRAIVRLAAAWPERVPMPQAALRPIPFEPAETRAAWPAAERAALAEFLPTPPAPSGAA
jgi:hypothetical protein